jgi:hypothetical protein
MTVNVIILRSYESDDRKAPWIPMVEIKGEWVSDKGYTTRKAALAWLNRWATQRGVEISFV